MPIIRGAASDVTTLTKANATQTTDPEKKSRTFVAPNKDVIAPIVRGSTMSMLPSSGTITFGYTGSIQRFTVHPQVAWVTVTLIGAGGGSHAGGSTWPGGAGGLVSGVLPVNAGETLNIIVGGGGGPQGVAGYGGGGTGWSTNTTSGGPPITNAPGGGGGRTAIRRSNDDIVTAGGGGGAGRGSDAGAGGAGGSATGAAGVGGTGKASGGGGGTSSAGGAAGSSSTEVGVVGSQYQGGNGATGVITGLSLSNAVGGTMTITGTIPAITGMTSGFSVVVSGSSDSRLNGTWVVSSWAANSVVVTTGVLVSISVTGATMRGNNDDTGGGGGGWYGGGGGGLDASGNYGGGGGGGSSYVARLDGSQPIVNTQGGGAAGGAADPSVQKSGGNGSCIIQYTTNPMLRNWKSPPFNGRIYIT